MVGLSRRVGLVPHPGKIHFPLFPAAEEADPAMVARQPLSREEHRRDTVCFAGLRDEKSLVHADAPLLSDVDQSVGGVRPPVLFAGDSVPGVGKLGIELGQLSRGVYPDLSGIA